MSIFEDNTVDIAKSCDLSHFALKLWSQEVMTPDCKVSHQTTTHNWVFTIGQFATQNCSFSSLLVFNYERN